MTTAKRQISNGLSQTSKGFYATLAVLTALVGLGIFAYSRQVIDGEIVTGLRDIGTMGGATWGLYVVFIIFFVGVSFAGITMASLVRLFKLKTPKPITRIAELLTVISLILGAIVVIADLGQPLRGFVNLFLYARPFSPLFYTFSLVISGYLFASLVYLYLGGHRDAAALAAQGKKPNWLFRAWAAGYQDKPSVHERHNRTLWWLALSIIPLLVIAHSTLGVIFGLQGGRPGWFGALQAPLFVILAAVSGIGFLIVILTILRKTLGLKKELSIDIFRWLGNFLWVLVITYIYLWVVEMLTAVYASPGHEAGVAHALLSGDYAGLFWTTAGLFVLAFGLLFTQFLSKQHSISLTFLAGLLVTVGAILKRYLVVIPSQTHGALLPYQVGSYSPTWVEYGVIVGLFALGTILYMVFIKVFPILPIHDHD